MAGGHVLGNGGVLVIAAHALMGGDAFALVEDLHRALGEAHLHFGPGEAVGHAVIVGADFDVIVDADAADAPLGQDVGLRRLLIGVDVQKDLADLQIRCLGGNRGHQALGEREAHPLVEG